MDNEPLSDKVLPDSEHNLNDNLTNQESIGGVSKPINDFESEYHGENDPIVDESYCFIDGRRHHNYPNLKYPLPNDDKEVNRLEREHYLFRDIWQGNYSAPIDVTLKEGGARVLDIGCGTGIWLMEMAIDFPLATFTGIDISPIWPQDVRQPNSNFLRYNILEGLPFSDNYFDYVHCRCCLTAFSIDEWINRVIPEMVRVAKPAAFIEHCECDALNVNAGPLMKKITDAGMSFGASLGVDGMLGDKLEELLLKNGNLTNIHHLQKYGPLGAWGGDYGRMNLENFRDICLAMRSLIAEFMGITPQEFEGIIHECVKEAEHFRTYRKIHRICAQKIAPKSN